MRFLTTWLLAIFLAVLAPTPAENSDVCWLDMPTIKTEPTAQTAAVKPVPSAVSRGGQYEVRRMVVTGYTTQDAGCTGITASGAKAVVGETVAAGPEFPFGTLLEIEGIGYRVVTDRGGAIKNGKLDVLFASKAEAFAFGRQTLNVRVVRKP